MPPSDLPIGNLAALPAGPDEQAATRRQRDARPPSRIAWMDYARGLAIILVVYGHCFRGLREAGYFAAGGLLSTIDYVIYGFHMPLFFFLSGAVSAKAFMLEPAAFVRGRMIAIAWPYVLWMSIELALLQAFAGVTNMGQVSAGLSTYAYQPLSPFWFLYTLFIANIALFACRSLPRPWLLSLAAMTFVAGQIVPVDIVRLTTWGLLYFCLGLCCATLVKRPGFVRYMAKPSQLVALAGATLLISLVLLQFDVGNRYDIPVALIGSAMIFGLAENMAREADRWPPLRLISFLGRISLTVLVVHVLGTAGTRILLAKALHVKLGWLHLIAGTAGGLAAPLALQLIGDYLGVLRPLGLPVARPMPGALPWWPRSKGAFSEGAG